MRRAPTIEVNILVHDKGKRNIVNNAEVEQSCKFRIDPLVQKAALEIEAKRKHHDRRTMQRKRTK